MKRYLQFFSGHHSQKVTGAVMDAEDPPVVCVRARFKGLEPVVHRCAKRRTRRPGSTNNIQVTSSAAHGSSHTRSLGECVCVLVTARLAHAVGRRHPEVRGSRVKHHREVLLRLTQTDLTEELRLYDSQPLQSQSHAFLQETNTFIQQ